MLNNGVIFILSAFLVAGVYKEYPEARDNVFTGLIVFSGLLGFWIIEAQKKIAELERWCRALHKKVYNVPDFSD